MRNNSIQYLRVLAMMMIVACHLVVHSENLYLQMSAQFLNVGVSIFFIISGFLYGVKMIKEDRHYLA